MAKAAFTEHPMFLRASFTANEVLMVALEDMGIPAATLDNFEAHANRVVDDMTKLLLRAYDARQVKSQAA